ncbi:MAG TPA: hypothetical protein VE690_06810, partial [Rhodopila sp.]|nr:hypothetical protein [Rhodopila sp.]
ITGIADPTATDGHCLTGSRIPIVPLQTIRDTPPDDLLVLPWPYGHDVPGKLHAFRQKGMQCWTLLPRIARV